jgi:phospholipid N-methyltransferase
MPIGSDVTRPWATGGIGGHVRRGCRTYGLGDADKTVQSTLFFREYLSNFMHVGAVLPSSAALGRAAAVYVISKDGPARILEAGAGTGSFTCEIVPHLQPGDQLDAVEINPLLLGYLQRRLAQDGSLSRPGVQVRLIQADLLRFPFGGQYDYIVFSLPLTIFPPEMVREVLEIMLDHLRPGGVFSYVRYALLGRLRYLVGNRQEQDDLSRRQAIIADYAQKYEVGRQLVLANMPPTWVTYWRK